MRYSELREGMRVHVCRGSQPARLCAVVTMVSGSVILKREDNGRTSMIDRGVWDEAYTRSYEFGKEPPSVEETRSRRERAPDPDQVVSELQRIRALLEDILLELRTAPALPGRAPTPDPDEKRPAPVHGNHAGTHSR